MKQLLCLLAALVVMTVGAQASDLPKDLTRAMPERAEELLRGEDFSGTEGFSGGIASLLEKVSGQIGTILHQRVRGGGVHSAGGHSLRCGGGFSCRGGGGKDSTVSAHGGGAVRDASDRWEPG